MKKIFLTLLLIVFLIGLVGFLFISTEQKGSLGCCRVRQTIKIERDVFPDGVIVGPSSPISIEDFCRYSGLPPGTTPQPVFIASDRWESVCQLNSINATIDWIFVIFIFLAVAYALNGIFVLLSASGNPGKVRLGKYSIICATILLIIAFLARTIPGILQLIMGL